MSLSGTTGRKLPKVSQPTSDSLEASEDSCNGINKRTGKKCNNSASKPIPGYLPLCRQHRDQQVRAGNCQYTVDPLNQTRCLRLLKWNPPYFELCREHVAWPQFPCFFLRLPVELRLRILGFLIPNGAIIDNNPRIAVIVNNPRGATRLMDYRALLLVNKSIHVEAEDVLYGSAVFKIDVRSGGVVMCCHALYTPRTADGRLSRDAEVNEMVDRHFRDEFPFHKVKNCDIEILLHDQSAYLAPNDGSDWNLEVEIYDLRDSVRALLGYLARMPRIHNMNVAVLCLGFAIQDRRAFEHTRLLTEPFMTMRRVRRPHLQDVYSVHHTQDTAAVYLDLMVFTRLQPRHRIVVPQVHRYDNPRLSCQDMEFETYRTEWQNIISSDGPKPVNPPVFRMFSELKKFYTELYQAALCSPPDLNRSILHQARVARESNDLELFYLVRNELVELWNGYMEDMQAIQTRMTRALDRMLSADPKNSAEDVYLSPPSSTSTTGVAGSSSRTGLWQDYALDITSFNEVQREPQSYCDPSRSYLGFYQSATGSADGPSVSHNTKRGSDVIEISDDEGVPSVSTKRLKQAEYQGKGKGKAVMIEIDDHD